MAEIINLRRARKARDRAARAAQADANRVTFGTPKPLRDQAKAEVERADRALDGHSLLPPVDGETDA